MMILFCSYIASLRPPYSGGITMLLWISLKYTWNKILWKICFSVWPLIDTLRQSLDIGYCTNCVRCKTKLYISYFTHGFVFVCTPRLWIPDHKTLPLLTALCLILAAPNLQTAVFLKTSNSAKKLLGKILNLNSSECLICLWL